MGKKAIDEKLMNANLPLAIRRVALSGAFPHIEAPRLGLSDALKDGGIGSLLSGDEADEAEKKKRHLLPRLRWGEKDAISDRRMQTIRGKIRSNYEKLLNSSDNPDLIALNERMSHDISQQIEKRLKELAEQVEIPL